MATVTLIDYRRHDLRTNVLTNPFWISSDLLVGSACEDKYAVCFSFPRAGVVTCVLDVVFQVVVTFTSSTLIDVGYCTLATDAVTTGGVGTTVDDDDYIKQTDITVGTAGYYRSTTGNTSDWLTARVALSGQSAPLHITGAATTVPAVMVLMSNTGTIAAGKGRVHMLICEVPGV